jgi:hypothetical protein
MPESRAHDPRKSCNWQVSVTDLTDPNIYTDVASVVTGAMPPELWDAIAAEK